jgi:hypothetical protein
MAYLFNKGIIFMLDVFLPNPVTIITDILANNPKESVIIL